MRSSSRAHEPASRSTKKLICLAKSVTIYAHYIQALLPHLTFATYHPAFAIYSIFLLSHSATFISSVSSRDHKPTLLICSTSTSLVEQSSFFPSLRVPYQSVTSHSCPSSLSDPGLVNVQCCAQFTSHGVTGSSILVSKSPCFQVFSSISSIPPTDFMGY